MPSLQSEQAVVDSFPGKKGWSITGRQNEQKSKETPIMLNGKATGEKTTELADTGNVIWTITSPDGGQVDKIIVKPSAHTGDFSPDPTTGDQTRATTYTVIEGPTKEVPASTSTTSPSNVNEAGLNDERSWNAANGKWGRVTHAEAAALNAKEAAAGRQLTIDERNAAIASAREDRAAAADARNAANQHEDNVRASNNAANTNEIQRARLALDTANANKVNVRVVGNQLVDDNGNVKFTGPADFKFQTAQDGTILMIDPANPTTPQTVWTPTKAPDLIPGQKPDQQTFVVRNPATGELTEVKNPAYKPPGAQQLQALHDGIAQIEGMWTRGEITPTQAQQYRDALQKNFDAQLQGTTPHAMEQERQQRDQARMQSAQSLLNQRVSSGSSMADSLLGSAVGIVGNKNFMDPSAIAGLSIFGGANSVPDFINTLGGGQGVLDAASGAAQRGLQGDQPGAAPGGDAATWLLSHSLNKPGATNGIRDVEGGIAPGGGLLPAGVAGTSGDPTIGQYPGQPGPDGSFMYGAGPGAVGPSGPPPMQLPEPMALPGNNNDMAQMLIQAALKGGLRSSYG